MAFPFRTPEFYAVPLGDPGPFTHQEVEQGSEPNVQGKGKGKYTVHAHYSNFIFTASTVAPQTIGDIGLLGIRTIEESGNASFVADVAPTRGDEKMVCIYSVFVLFTLLIGSSWSIAQVSLLLSHPPLPSHLRPPPSRSRPLGSLPDAGTRTLKLRPCTGMI